MDVTSRGPSFKTAILLIAILDHLLALERQTSWALLFMELFLSLTVVLREGLLNFMEILTPLYMTVVFMMSLILFKVGSINDIHEPSLVILTYPLPLALISRRYSQQEQGLLLFSILTNFLQVGPTVTRLKVLKIVH